MPGRRKAINVPPPGPGNRQINYLEALECAIKRAAQGEPVTIYRAPIEGIPGRRWEFFLAPGLHVAAPVGWERAGYADPVEIAQMYKESGWFHPPKNTKPRRGR